MGSHAMTTNDNVAIFADEDWNDLNNITTICMSLAKINAKGSFLESNPLHNSVPLLLMHFVLASTAIFFTSQLLKPLCQPIFVSQILGGIILGPSVLGRSFTFMNNFFPIRGFILLDIISSLGFMFYFFLIGVQTDPWILKKIDRKTSTIGLSTTVVPMFISQVYCHLLPLLFTIEPRIATSLPVAALAESVLSFPTIAFFLAELKIINSEFGRVATTSSLISCLFSLVVTTFCVLMKQSPDDNLKMLSTICAGFIVTVVIVFAIRPMIIWMIRKNPAGEPLKESHIIALFVGVLVTGFFCQATGLHIYYGPFILGITIPAGPPLGSALMEKLEIATSWILMPIFYAKNGMVIDIFSVSFKNYMIVQSVALIAALGKFMAAFFTSIRNSFPVKDAITLGLVMNAQGLMELGLLKMMKINRALDKETYVVLCISMLIILGGITPLIKWLYNPSRRYVVYSKRTVMHSNPNAELRVLVCVNDQDDTPNAINLLEALNPKKSSPLTVYVIDQIELVGRASPLLISHKLTRMSSSNASLSEKVVNAFRCYEQNSHGPVSVHPFTAISPCSTMHDDICSLALDKSTSLVIIPFYKRFQANGRTQLYKKIGRTITKKVINKAPCSVAILVDRGLLNTSRPSLESWSWYRVAVLFLGGADDREALAIAERMCGHPNICLTLIRFVNGNSIYDDVEETRVDNELLSEFRQWMEGNNRVIYIEEVVMDGLGTVAVIRSMENNYELVLVGRSHDPASPTLFGLRDWNEQPELGPIGEILASADFMGNTTILVVQQHTKVAKEDNETRKGHFWEAFSLEDDKEDTPFRCSSL